MEYNILQYLEKNMELYPDKKAIADEKNSMNYLEYGKCAQQIGTFLVRKLDGKSNEPVAVIIDRNIQSIIAFMGVVYSGNFYVPIDASMPEERINLIYDTLKPVVVLDARDKEMSFRGSMAVKDILRNTEIELNSLTAVRNYMIDTDPLYSIFTSGSTGVPKGVVVSHRSVIDLVKAFEEAFDFDESQVFANQAPFDFDVSVKDIYNSLYNGASLEVLPKKLFKMPKILVSYLNERKIDTLIWAVSALRIVADFRTLDFTTCPSLKYIMFSGEIMPVKALNYWMDHVPTAVYVNLYGPTEITCNCTYYEIKERHKDDEILPIGKAFKNSRVIIRDTEGKVISAKKQIGEICVAGACLSLGYWNNREKTDSVFIQNKQITAYESKIYATGDMGYYDEKSNIVFASRKDFQIKHMGHRIELGEIEAALNASSFLNVSCCLYDAVNEKIVCFYEAESDCKKEIIMELAQKLPKYMWPNVYMRYENLPMNKNCKIDRVLLGEQLNKKETEME